MQCLSRTGGLVSNYAGTTTYKYTTSNGWTVTITNPNVNIPVYTVSVIYTQQLMWWFTPDKVVVNFGRAPDKVE